MLYGLFHFLLPSGHETSSGQIHAFFRSNTHLSNARLKLAIIQGNSTQHPENEL